MRRSLQYFNLLGVFALAALCVIQWQANRQLNLEANESEKTRLDQALKLQEQAKTINGYRADLDSFRDQLARANQTQKETDSKLTAAQRDIRQLSDERDQLKTSVTNWANVVTARDEQLKQTSEQLQHLAAARNDAVETFNALAEKYNAVVKDLSERTRQFNALIEKYNKAVTQ